MLWRESILITGIFLLSLADLVLCLLAFSDMAQFRLRPVRVLAEWFLLCALLPVAGSLFYLLTMEKQRA